jgi:hypothetical protein
VREFTDFPLGWQINAKHAQEQARATKAAALELLRKNSRNAAAAVLAFTDAESIRQRHSR